MRRSRPQSQIALKALAATGAGLLAYHGLRLAAYLLGPKVPYRMNGRIGQPLGSEAFAQYLSVVTDAAVCRDTQIEVLTNGSAFYPAYLEAIAAAQHSIQLEYFLFLEGQVTRKILHALTERARTGVKVKVLLDGIGSLGTHDSYFQELRGAGGELHWYHRFGLRSLPHMNHRTHRKLLVVDGEVGFIGGAGMADEWLTGVHGKPAWRDTVFRVRGRAVAGMMSALAENWLECTGEILTETMPIPSKDPEERTLSMVVISTPQEGTTRARMLFQVLMDSATECIRITTPYFLPDRSARQALLRAMKRGVKVQILTCGKHSDHQSIVKLSRTMELDLLRAGAEIYEYEAAMMHSKLLVIDEQWCVFGSTNFDDRSFALNDEINMAALDRELAACLKRDYLEDLKVSRPVTVDLIRDRSVTTRVADNVAWIVRREE